MINSELLAEAMQFHAQGAWKEAIDCYQKILEQTPDDAQVWHLLGILSAQKKDFIAAKTYLEKAIALAPQDANFYNSMGNLLKQEKDWSAAEDYYEKALALNPDSAETHNNLAIIFYQQGLYDLALNHYALAVNLQPAYVDAHFNLGLLFLKQEKIAEAIKQFRNVTVLDPNKISAQQYLADLLLQSDKPDEAKKYYQTVLAAQPENLEALNNLGVCHLKLNDLEQAAQLFTQVLAIDETHLDARNNLAASYLQEERYQNAARHYQILIDLNPNDIEANYNLAVAQMAIGELKAAEKHFQFVLDHNPQHVAALCNLGALEIKWHNLAKAIAYYQQAKMIAPNDKLINYILAALTQESAQTTAPDDYVTNLFDNYAGYYDKHVAEVLQYQVPKLIREIIDAYLIKQNITKKLTILDLGCGTGLTGSALQAMASKLIGVDLSNKMLNSAKLKNCYDQLYCSEISDFLRQDKEQYDLIVAADVFVYIGDLAEIFTLCRQHLAAEGLFVFSVEANAETKNYILQSSARFAHNKDYLIALAKENDFAIVELKEITLRYQEQEPVFGYIFLLRNNIPSPA